MWAYSGSIVVFWEPIVEKILTHTLANGITIVGEPMPGVSSAALSVLIPVGAAVDPEGFEGSANILAEMMHRGAGPYDNRALSQEYEKLGTQAGHSAGVELSSISTTLLGENLPRAIELVGHTIRRPRLPEEELENVVQLALQELKSLEDEPSSKVMVELSKDLYAPPFGKNSMGTVEGLQNITIDSIRDFYQKQFVPTKLMIGVAGNFDWSQVIQSLEKELGDWQGEKTLVQPKALKKVDSSRHLHKETSQLQIALAYPSVAIDHPDYYVARVGVGILSGGMAGRLFIEVREKRGLVYRVSASHSGSINRAAIFCYAGTTTERADETLQVMVEELRKLSKGVSKEELQRSKADLKSRIVLSSESSSSRAGSIVSDIWNLGRVRTLDEIKQAIDNVTGDHLERHLNEYTVSPITLMTLGQKGLEIPQ